MKKILIGILIILNTKSNAQITYEHTYPFVNSPALAQPTLIDMGNNDYKYYYVDYAANQLRLFNLDHSPYSTINVPVTLTNPVLDYQIGYITKSLFDCDTTMFEYAIWASDYRHNFYIYRQDGTLLFERDSTIGPWCFACGGGAYDIKPIVNSPAGTKLFLAKADTSGFFHTVDVYSLCGNLPENVIEMNAVTATFVNAYPNPTTGKIDFQFDLPSNFQKYELIIYNSSAQVIKTITLHGTTGIYHLDDILISSGLFFYTLNNENKILQNGKFILNK